MKRFYATLALLGAVTLGASAQTRQCNIEVVTIAPMSASGAYEINCTSDSVMQSVYIVNHGPDNILPEDSFLVNDPRTTGMDYFYSFGGATLNAGDTMGIFNSKVAISKIKWLAEPNSSGTLDEVLRADLVNGNQYVWMNIVSLTGFSPNPHSVDPDESNNSGQTLVSWTCNTNGIKDVNFSKTALNIFPNPAQNQISFTNDFAATSTAVIKITDVAGRVVKSVDFGKQNAGSKTYNVDIAELNNGMYYIELVTDNTRSISKFTKN